MWNFREILLIIILNFTLNNIPLFHISILAGLGFSIDKKIFLKKFCCFNELSMLLQWIYKISNKASYSLFKDKEEFLSSSKLIDKKESKEAFSLLTKSKN